MYFFEEVLRDLNKEKVKYLVVGGIAVNLYGFFRTTGDLDVILYLEDSNLKKFIKCVKKLKLKPRVPVALDDFADAARRNGWIINKNMKAFGLEKPGDPLDHIDVVIDHKLDFNKAYKRRKMIKEGDLRIPVLSIDDLIKMKKATGRERDAIDVNALREIQRLENDKGKK